MVRALEITTLIGCANACFFCPQKTLVKNYKSTIRLFSPEALKDCLRTVPDDVRIDFSGYAEPFFNPAAVDLMRFCLGAGRCVHLYTTLMGIKEGDLPMFQMSPQKPEYIIIHVPDKHGLILDDDKWIAQHELFARTGWAIKIAAYMAMGELSDKVRQYLANYRVRVVLPPMFSRGGNVDVVKVKYKEGPIRCAAQRWHSNVLLPNGDVYACCMDYGLTLKLGNLLSQPYSEIDAKATEYEVNVNLPADSICRSCEWSASVKAATS